MSFMTGTWKKKQRTGADIVKYYHAPTVHQLNFLHELANQHLGHAPSLGHENMPWHFPQVPPETWNYIRGATRQPVHEYARLMTNGSDPSKKACGVTQGVIDVISKAGAAAIKYGGTVVRTLIKHQDSIRTGVKIAKDVVDLGALIGNITGITSDDTLKKTRAVTSAVEGASKRYATKPKPKKGEGWHDFDTLL